MYRLTFALLTVLAIGCSTPTATSPSGSDSPTAPAPAPAASYAGDWDLTIRNTPVGTFTGVLSITETDDGLSGTLTSSGQTIDMRSVEQTDDGMRVEFYSTDYQMDIDIRLTGDPGDVSLTGTTLGDYTTVATRK
jgi:hypothetical protein